MDIYKKLKVKTYINAWDAVSAYGSSRMEEETLLAMREAATRFVHIEELQKAVGREIAKMTDNEAAYVVAGTAAGMLMASAVCMVRHPEPELFAMLPDASELRNEFILLRERKTSVGYAIKAAGGKVIDVAFGQHVTLEDVERAITPKTCAIVYCDTQVLSMRCPPLRALTLLAAYAYSGEKSFLDAAYLCNDFHNGANPNGTTMTSGLGYRCPVRFLDFTSYADGIAEFVPGITPYRNTYGIARDDVRLAHGLYYGKRPEAGFAGISKSLLPLSLRGGRELAEDESAKLLSRAWPIWRRWANVELYSVAASEYTVWETIAPAAAATGLLLDRAYPPEPGAKERVPAADITQLPGYAPLP